MTIHVTGQTPGGSTKTCMRAGPLAATKGILIGLLPRRAARAALVVIATAMGPGTSVIAQTTKTWTSTSSTAWATAANWQSNLIGGSTTSTNNDIALFSSSGVLSSIGLNFSNLGTPFYLGTIQVTSGPRTFGSSASTSGNITLNGTGANSLVLDNQSASAMSVNAFNGSTVGAMFVRLTAANSTINAGGDIGIAAQLIESPAGRSITKTGAGTLTFSNQNLYTGSTTISTGTLALSGSWANTVGSSSEVALATGTTLDVTGVPSSAALVTSNTLSGNGAVINSAPSKVYTNGGTIAPGGSIAAGTLTFSSNLDVTNSNNIQIELGGTTAGQFDVLSIAGAYAAGGTITVSLINSFTPAAGNSFQIFQGAGTRTGAQVFSLPSLPAGLSWDTSIFNSTGTIRVCATSGATPANTITDANQTGATVNGTLGANEYGTGNSNVFSGGGTGFGGVIGGASAKIYMKSDTSNLYIGFQPGAAVNDVVVIYLDTNQCSGQTDATMGDVSSSDRGVISNLGSFGNDTFPVQPDFAITIWNSGAGAFLYQLTNGTHTFISNANIIPSAAGTTAVFREMSIPLTTLGLSPGSALDFFVAYCSTGNFNSNESIPPISALNSGTNPGTTATANYSAFDRYILNLPCTPIGTVTGPSAPATQCAGSTVNLSVSISAGTSPQYQWRKNTVNLSNVGTVSGATSPTLTITGTVNGDTGSYDCRVTNTCTGSPVTSSAVTLTVNTAPGTPTSPVASPASYCSGAAPSTVTLSAALSGGTSIQWFTGSCGGTAVTPISSTATSVTIAAPSSTTTYFARATDGTCNSAACAQTTVTVNAATVIGTPPSSTSACVGGTIQFTVGATGTGLSYQWKKGGSPLSNGGTISGATSNQLTITGVVSGDTGSYTVDVLSSSCATVTPAAATLTVISPPSAGLSVSPAAATVCSGSSTTINVAGSETGVSYQLRVGTTAVTGSAPVTGTGGSIALSTGTTPLTATTTYNVLATASGCTATQLTQTATVNVSAVPNTPTGTGSYSPITGSALVISASVNVGETVDWYTGSCGGTLVATGQTSFSIASVAAGSTSYFARARNTTTNCISTACLTVTVTGTGQVVISQIYGGGGNTYTQDFVELFNRGTTAVSLTGVSLQYASDTGTSWSNAIGSSATVNGSIQPGGYFLIGLATASGGAPLPTTDRTGTQNLSQASGKLALVSGTTLLSGANPSGGPTVLDFVGYGTTTTVTTGYEGTNPAPGLSATTADFRISNGCQDTNQNLSDFAASTPRPRNSSSPRNICAGGLTDVITDTAGVTATLDGAIGTNEYGTSNSYQFGGDGFSFAGMLGYFANAGAATANPSIARIFMSSDASGVTIAVRAGAAVTGADNIVVLLDTQAGGSTSSTSFSDLADPGRASISRALRSGRPPTFGVDYAVAFSTSGAFLFSFDGTSLVFVAGTSATGSVATSGGVLEMRIPYSLINNFAAGGNIDLIASLSNGNTSTTTMSDETVPVSPALSGAGNQGTAGGGTFTNFDRFTTFCPSPTISLSVAPTTSSICGSGTSSITVANSEVGVSYQLRVGTTPVVGTPVQAGTGGTLTFSTGTISSTTTYNVLATRTTCSSSAQLAQTATVAVSQSPNDGIPVGTSDSAVCLGGSTFIFVDNTESGVSYQLLANAAPAGSPQIGNGGTLTFSFGPINSTTTFSVTATNAPCPPVTLTHVRPVGILEGTTTDGPRSTSQCFGTSTGFAVTGIGTGPFTYLWQQSTDGGGTWTTAAGTGGTTVELVTSPIATDGTLFRCIITGACGAATTTVATLTVNASTTTTNPTGATVCAGQPASFSVTAGGTGPFHFQWKHDGSNVGPDSSTYSIGSTVAGDAGSYTCVVSGGCGMATSGGASLVVNPLPVAPTGANASSSTYCTGSLPPGNTITLNATGGSGTTLRWFDDTCGGNSIGTGNGLVIAAPTSVGVHTYYARYESDTCGNSACVSTTVTVNQTPNAALGVNAEQPIRCVGDPAVIDVHQSEVGVLYQLRIGTTIVGSSYLGDGTTANLIFSPLPAGPTTFNVLATRNGCSVQMAQTATITTQSPATTPAAAVASVTSYCADAVPSSIDLSVIGGSGDTVHWFTGGCNSMQLQPGVGNPYTLTGPEVPTSGSVTYYANWQNNCGTSSCASVTVTVNPLTTTSDPASQTVCEATPTSFSVTAGGTPPFHYQWKHDGSDVGTDSSTYSIPSAAATDAGMYSCVVTGACSSATSAGATLVVNATTAISTQPPSAASQCSGFSTTFGLIAGGTGPITYLWEQSTDSGATWGPADGVNTNTTYSTATTAADQTLYRCQVSGACGNATSNTVTLTVTPNVSLTVSMQLQGVTSGTFTRCIWIDLYTVASCPAPAFSSQQTITFVNGLGSAAVSAGCDTYTGVSVRDPAHTLRRVATAMPSFNASDPSHLVGTFTTASGKPLIGGNLNNDAFIDILDFGGFIGQNGTSPGASTSCPPSGLNADFSGNGIVGSEDFTFIQSNFFVAREADPCGAPLSGEQPVAEISVAELVARGDWDIARGDLNHDGRLNAADVAFAAVHGLPACIADFNGLDGVNLQDIFDYISSWLAGHPATDTNRDRQINVQDLFDFIEAWFHGC